MNAEFLDGFSTDELRVIARFCREVAGAAEWVIDERESEVVEDVPVVEPRHARAAAFRFSMVGIPIGSTLEFDDPRIGRDSVLACVTTVDDANKVELNGKTVSLSYAAKLLSNQTAAQGARYFLYQGERLTDLRARMEGEHE